MLLEEFLKTHPACKVVKNSVVAREIYESILWKEENRIKMAEFSDLGIPALAAVVEEIEQCCENHQVQDLDISDNFIKQIVGRMVATSLEPLGYQPKVKKRIPKDYVRHYFKNATQYALTGNANEMIKKRIVTLES